ncbi:hypothetical protein [Bacillus cereus]|uniref:hypothetical protein n=1 Tax=Bacillus cereus TaxID=1396 RepID=UPI002852C76F|nr:hypothetical protein [Bacillus cereus]
MLKKMKEAIKKISEKQTPEAVWHYNTIVIGIQNYYVVATHIDKNLDQMSCQRIRTLYHRLGRDWKRATKHNIPSTLGAMYRNHNLKFYKIQDIIVLIPSIL